MSPGELSPRKFETLVVRTERHVTHIQLNRPQCANAIDNAMLNDLHNAIRFYGRHPPTRAIVISGVGKCFSKGMDFKNNSPTTVIHDILANKDLDVSRKGRFVQKQILDAQRVFSALEQCPKPTIAAIHGKCKGAALDIASACDIRFATINASFSVKFTGVDFGTIARLAKVCGNQAWVFHHVCALSTFDADDALQHDFLLRTFDNREEMTDGVTKYAEHIAHKSPIAVQGTKAILNYSQNHSVRDSLEYTMNLSQSQNLNRDIAQVTLKVLNKSPGPIRFENV